MKVLLKIRKKQEKQNKNKAVFLCISGEFATFAAIIHDACSAESLQTHFRPI
jgi:hypothetical protein